MLVLPGYPTEHTHELRTHSAELGVADEVRFVGWVSSADLEGLYRLASCFVFPSLYEGFGWPILEAQACGCPVATTNRAPMDDAAGEGGFIHQQQDIKRVAIFSQGGRNEAKIIGKYHAVRQHLAEGERA